MCLCVCVSEREKGPEGDTQMSMLLIALGAVGMEGISEADPCLVRPEAYTILEPLQISYERQYLFGGLQIH